MSSNLSIRDCFYEYTPRPQQEAAMRFLEDNWDTADVLVLQLPVAVGKSNLSMALARWVSKKYKKKSNILVPTNVLLDQYKKSFPRLHFLQRKDLYRCRRFADRPEIPLQDANCHYMRQLFEHGCNDCCYTKAVRQSHVVPYMVCNYWTFMAHKLYRPVVIMDECFPKETLIRLGSGKTQTIGEITRRFETGENITVSSWNGSEFVSKRVTNAWCSGVKNLVTVRTPAGVIRCTASHKFLTKQGYKEAATLTTEDRIIAENSRTGLWGLTPVQEQVVAGSKLGDGYVHKDPHCTTGVRLSIRHGKKQLEYLEFKASILQVSVKTSGKSGYTGEEQYVCQTKYIDFKDSKIYALDILQPLGLAIWFCDDGSLGHNVHGITNSGRIHVESWTAEEIAHAQKILHTRFGIDTTLQFYKKERYPVLILNKENITKLLNIIVTYIPDCMAYKRGSVSGLFNPKHIQHNPNLRHKLIPVLEVLDKGESAPVYDITVEDLHNFVVITHRMAKSGVVVHNCHNLINIIRDLEGKRLWRKDYHYPSTITTYGDLLRWVEKHPRREHDKKLAALYTELSEGRQHYLIETGVDLYRGREEECLKLLPIDVRNAKPYLWPKKVEKLVLLSATFTEVDLEMLGLKGRRVAVMETGSPIPPDRRPVHFMPIVNSSYQFQDAAVPKLAEFLIELADARPGTRGFVHTTYGMAAKLRRHLITDTRFIFHDSETKTSLYEIWRNSPVEEGKIFVGCGMEEGIDLKGPEFGWQVLTKAQYASLSEPAIKHQAEERPKEYTWDAMRKCAQACGRICRDPEDFGETYLCDLTFRRLFRQSDVFGIVPTWLREQLTNAEELFE